ncbi:Peptidase aspartic catalytic [Penicillium herquei]|nr:Peptidase aspartic catalytic [Penicillium herquei]
MAGSQLTLPLTLNPVSFTSNHTASLLSAEYGTTFNVEVTLANQTFKLLVDTGSSDTYVVRQDFVCIDQTTNLEISQEAYRYGSQYNQSSTYHVIPNQTFGVQYGNGIASGVMAYEDVTLAGITVLGQIVGIADHSTPTGDGVNSGVLGLAYPSLTSAHPGNYADNTTFFFDREVYSPLFNTMYERGLVKEPYFSIALAHTPRNFSTPTFGGYLTLGDLPPVAYKPEFSRVRVEILENIPPLFTSGNRHDHIGLLLILPARIVDPINALFNPPAVYNEDLGVSIVDCDAEPPIFGVEIGGQMFYHNGRDLIFQIDDGVCVSGFLASENVSYEDIVLNILGVPFLKNVVSVYDFGNNELRFAQRVD